MNLNRRQFLALAIGALAGAALSTYRYVRTGEPASAASAVLLFGIFTMCHGEVTR